MKDIHKFSYLEALIVVHNNMMVELATNKLNVRMLTEQSLVSPAGNMQLEQNLLHFKTLVGKITQSIQQLSKMIQEEEGIEKRFKNDVVDKEGKN